MRTKLFTKRRTAEEKTRRDIERADAARALGIRVCLMKPVSVHELAFAVRKALDTKKEFS
jgi:DNA-binding NarL/FixJ family response regulator